MVFKAFKDLAIARRNKSKCNLVQVRFQMLVENNYKGRQVDYGDGDNILANLSAP